MYIMDRAEKKDEFKMNGVKYSIFRQRVNDMAVCFIESDLKVATPVVSDISFNYDTNTFEMTDFVEIDGRNVKIMFNLDLSLKIVGFIYNDLDNSYDLITEDEDTEVVYTNYSLNKVEKLREYLKMKETEYKKNNAKMLYLANKK